MVNQISGFWRRVGALLIDLLILGVVGLVLGIFFDQQFVLMGGWGRALGFVIAASYFSVLNSSIGEGQTIGKRVLSIQVVDSNGELLNLPKSMLRYIVLGIPYFLNGAMVPDDILHSFMIFIISLLVFGFGFSIIYLVIFNRHTRQSLHDIVLKTYVIQKNIVSTEPLNPVWKVHYVVCGIVMVISLLAPVYLNQMGKSDFFSELMTTRKQILSIPKVVNATIFEGKSFLKSSGGEQSTTTFLRSVVFVSTGNVDDQNLSAKVANTIIQVHKKAIEKDVINVSLTYGYDIGIASSWKSHHYSMTPEAWQKLEN